MKRIERALDGKPDHHHANRGDQRDIISPLCIDIQNALLDVAHQKMPCNII